jgi:hypothetical protein
MALSSSRYLALMYHMCNSSLNTNLRSTSHCHPKTIPKSRWCVLSEILIQYDFGDLPNHLLEMNIEKILNDPTSRNPMISVRWAWRPGNCLNSAYPPTRQFSIQVPTDNETKMCRNTAMNEVLFLTKDQWHVGQEIKHVIFSRILGNVTL